MLCAGRPRLSQPEGLGPTCMQLPASDDLPPALDYCGKARSAPHPALSQKALDRTILSGCTESQFTLLLELISIYGNLCLRRKEASAMGTLRFADLQAHPTEVLDLTSLTVGELHQLVPPFEAAFQAHMAAWRLD